jgi:hypothetical protein
LFPSAGTESSFKASGVGKQSSGVIQKECSVASQRDATGRAIDKPCGQLFLKKLDVSPKCRWHHSQFLGRTPEMQFLRRHHETS